MTLYFPNSLVGGWGGVDEAKQEILESIKMFQDAPEKPNF